MRITQISRSELETQADRQWWSAHALSASPQATWESEGTSASGGPGIHPALPQGDPWLLMAFRREAPVLATTNPVAAALPVGVVQFGCSAFPCVFVHVAWMPGIPGGITDRHLALKCSRLGPCPSLLEHLPSHCGATCVHVCMSALLLSGLSRAEHNHCWRWLLAPGIYFTPLSSRIFTPTTRY